MGELSKVDLGLDGVKKYTDLAGGDIDELLKKCEEAKIAIEQHDIEIENAKKNAEEGQY